MIDHITWKVEYAEFTFELNEDLEIIGCKWTDNGDRINPEAAYQFSGFREESVRWKAEDEITKRRFEVMAMAKGWDI